jgi:hypothetical protein
LQTRHKHCPTLLRRKLSALSGARASLRLRSHMGSQVHTATRPRLSAGSPHELLLQDCLACSCSPWPSLEAPC